MKKLLVICPSMSRVDKMVTFLDSFSKTKSDGTDLIMGLDQNDPQYPAYLKLSERQGQDFGIGLFSGENITEIFNAVAMNLENDYDYYMPINDDFVFKTDKWDSELINTLSGRKGIAVPNDLFQSAYPSTSIISGEIVRGLGWLQMPTLTHLCGDIVWQTIGDGANCIYRNDDVIIEHRHFVTGKSAPDSISEKTNSTEMYQKDWAAYNSWLASDSKEDIRKVREIINANR